jgi:hypothetical protein
MARSYVTVGKWSLSTKYSPSGTPAQRPRRQSKPLQPTYSAPLLHQHQGRHAGTPARGTFRATTRRAWPPRLAPSLRSEPRPSVRRRPCLPESPARARRRGFRSVLVTGRTRQSRRRRYVGLLRPGRQAVLSATPCRRKVPRFPLIDRSVTDQNVEVRFVLPNEVLGRGGRCEPYGLTRGLRSPSGQALDVSRSQPDHNRALLGESTCRCRRVS